MTDEFDRAKVMACARLLSDFELDEQIAVAAARARVADAHLLRMTADMWHQVTIAFDDVRRERKALADAVAEAMGATWVEETDDES